MACDAHSAQINSCIIISTKALPKYNVDPVTSSPSLCPSSPAINLHVDKNLRKWTINGRPVWILVTCFVYIHLCETWPVCQLVKSGISWTIVIWLLEGFTTSWSDTQWRLPVPHSHWPHQMKAAQLFDWLAYPYFIASFKTTRWNLRVSTLFIIIGYPLLLAGVSHCTAHFFAVLHLLSVAPQQNPACQQHHRCRIWPGKETVSHFTQVLYFLRGERWRGWLPLPVHCTLQTG